MNIEKDVQHIALAGEVTVFNASAIRDQLLGALNETGDLDVDLSQVSEIDTAGVQLILAAKREAAACNKTIRFSGCSDTVFDVMALLGLSAYLTDAMSAELRA